MSTYGEKSIALHRKNHGKIALALKVEINNKEDLATVYTPGVADVCKEIVADKSRAKELTLKHNTIAVITDGSAVLGLGNIGALAGLPVMEGKCALFKRFARLDAFPICLDTQDPEEIITAVKHISPVFAGINLEDISAPKCFEIERRLKQELNIPVMHDDQHGTAVVVLAGLINALKVKGLRAEEAKIVINGAGAAGLAIADLLLQFGISNLTLVDSQGVISNERLDLNSEKLAILGKIESAISSLRGIREEAIPNVIISGLPRSQSLPRNSSVATLAHAVVKSDVFIGVSKGGVLTSEMVQTMNDLPVVFALANPTPEIMPDVAKEAGAFIVATGRSDFPNQINNGLVFPGIFRGAVDNGVVQITDEMLIRAAKNLAGLVEKPTPEQILPDAFDERVVSAVASAICD